MLAFAVALLAASAPLIDAASRKTYTTNAVNGIVTLNRQYRNKETGLWGKDWWNSANALTTLTNVARIDPTRMDKTKYMLDVTYKKAPQHKVAGGKVGTFLNAYYDDEAWWALAWIDAYDLTKNTTYLKAAQDIFEDLRANPGTPCGGKRWAKIGDVRVAAIANTLFLDVAASLANRVPAKKTYYTALATESYDWVVKRGFLNASGNNTVLDGLDPKTCKPGGYVWTYNTGALIGAMIEMFKLTGNRNFLAYAVTLGRGIVLHNVDKDGILTEYGYPRKPTMYASNAIKGDFAQFKGVFARNLANLQKYSPQPMFLKFLQKNADAIWAKSRDEKGLLGANWQGPVSAVGVQSQSSAVDCLVAAAMVS